MITAVHAIIFSQDAEGVRDFLRDAIGLRSVDAGGGWLIFALPPAELAAHRSDEHPHHELYLMCDDIHATAKDLKAKEVELTREVTDERWGLTTALGLPGAGRLGLYQPKHPSPAPLSS